MTIKRFGDIIRTHDRSEMRPFLPPMARILEPPRGSDSYELRLGSTAFEDFRYLYGFIGSIKRLPRSNNTSTAFLRHVVVKLVWIDDSLPYPEHRCAFARVLAYSADFADSFLGPEFILSVRDFVQGMAAAPHGPTHTGANLTYWRFANLTE